MAAITSTQAGDWSSSSTWTGGTIPGVGDSATINHAITVSDTRVIGTSPDDNNSTFDLVLNAGLTIEDGGSLTLRSNAQIDAVQLMVEAGGFLQFDTSNASSPPSAYAIRPKATGAKIHAIGTSGNRATIQGINGSFGGFFGNSSFDGPYLDFRFADVNNMGSSVFVNIYPNNSAAYLIFRDSRFDNVSAVNTLHPIHSNATFEVLDCNFQNSRGSWNFDLNGSQSLGTGTRSFIRTVCDNQVRFYPVGGFTVEDSVFLADVVFLNAGNITPAAWVRNLIRRTTQSSLPWYGGTMDETYVLLDHSTTNPHGISTGSQAVSVILDGLVFELTGTTTNGDMILASSAGAGNGADVTIQNCLVLPNAGGNQSGTLLSLLGESGKTYRLRHNTAMVTALPGGLVVGETYDGHADIVADFRSNLFWSNTAGEARKARQASGSVQGLITEANCDYNAGFNLTAGSEGGGYDLDLAGSFGVDFGENDVDQNPEFFDETRDIASWDSSLGGVGSVANAIAELGKMNLGGWNSNYTPAALLDWVKAGFAPTNASFDAAAHDGGTIGAIPFSSAETPIVKTVNETTRI